MIDVAVMQKLLALKIPRATLQAVVAIIGEIQSPLEERRRLDRERKKATYIPRNSKEPPQRNGGESADTPVENPEQKEIPSALLLEKKHLLTTPSSLDASSEESKEVEEVVVVGTARARDATAMPFRDRFDEFWAAYPLHKGKQEALKKFIAVIGKRLATPDDLITGAARYATARRGEDPKFTKHPATWLNAGCWADEPDPKFNGGLNGHVQQGRSSGGGFARLAVACAQQAAADRGRADPDDGSPAFDLEPNR